MPTTSASYSGFVDGDTPADLSAPPPVSRAPPVRHRWARTPARVRSSRLQVQYRLRRRHDHSEPGHPYDHRVEWESNLRGLLPTISAQYSGFVDGDTPVDLTSLPPASRAPPVRHRWWATTSARARGRSTPTTTSSTSTARPRRPGNAHHHRLEREPGLRGPGADHLGRYLGFVDGDTPADLTSLPPASRAPPARHRSGTYTSSCSGAANPTTSSTMSMAVPRSLNTSCQRSPSPPRARARPSGLVPTVSAGYAASSTATPRPTSRRCPRASRAPPVRHRCWAPTPARAQERSTPTTTSSTSTARPRWTRLP